MNRRVILVCGLFVVVAAAMGASAGGDAETTGDPLSDAREATDRARAMVALAGQPWAARGVGAGVGTALGLVVGGLVAFAAYRGST